jgi:myo-inositol-1(or 4)-monophosphatase
VVNPWKSDLELALAAAQAASVRIMESFRTEQVVDYKTPSQPVTEADRAADRILHEILLADRPDYGWLSEETADNPKRLDQERVWIVDPIDGTRSFISGRPEFAVSIGLWVNGAITVGVIANPATDEYFFATRGGGAFAQSAVDASTRRAIAVSSKADLNEAKLAASRSEIKAGEFEAFHGVLHIMPTGSTAYKMARVATGEAEIFLSRGPKSEWDIAAGDLIVQEAGGRVCDLRGEPLRYNQRDTQVHGILACNSQLRDRALALVDRLPPQF